MSPERIRHAQELNAQRIRWALALRPGGVRGMIEGSRRDVCALVWRDSLRRGEMLLSALLRPTLVPVPPPLHANPLFERLPRRRGTWLALRTFTRVLGEYRKQGLALDLLKACDSREVVEELHDHLVSDWAYALKKERAWRKARRIERSRRVALYALKQIQDRSPLFRRPASGVEELCGELSAGRRQPGDRTDVEVSPGGHGVGAFCPSYAVFDMEPQQKLSAFSL